MSERDQNIGLGPYDGNPTISAAATLGTTPTLIALPTDASGRRRRVKIRVTNPNSANFIAWTVVDKGAAAPTIVATFGAGAGIHVLPRSTIEFSIYDNKDFYIVADALAQSYSVSMFLF